MLKHRILRWFPRSGFVSASTVGAKNMASSSGCAIKRQIRLFDNRGKEPVKGEEVVEENDQKTKTPAIATASPTQLKDARDGRVGMVVRGWR